MYSGTQLISPKSEDYKRIAGSRRFIEKFSGSSLLLFSFSFDIHRFVLV
jgi:hypothetical protein